MVGRQGSRDHHRALLAGGAGDSLVLSGFGTPAGGATFTQVGASNQWQVHSGLDRHNEFITLLNAATVHASAYALV